MLDTKSTTPFPPPPPAAPKAGTLQTCHGEMGCWEVRHAAPQTSNAAQTPGQTPRPDYVRLEQTPLKAQEM